MKKLKLKRWGLLVMAAISLSGVTTAVTAPVQAHAATFKLAKAKAAVAMNADTGKVVWSKAGNTARPIASVSKIMTLYLTLAKVNGKQSNWNHKVKITSRGLVSMSRADQKRTRRNSSHDQISHAVVCLQKYTSVSSTQPPFIQRTPRHDM